MNHPMQLFVDSLNVEFHHIKTYELDYNWRIPERTLPQSVLWYVEEGRIHASVNGVGYTAAAGQWLHLPEGGALSAHSISSGVKLISVNFEASVPMMPNRPWHELLRFPVFWASAPSETFPLLGEMAADSAKIGIARSMLLRAGMLRMLGLLIDRYMTDASSAALSADHRINRIIAYLTGHPREMPSVTALAELVQLSESHLRKLFRQHVGMAPQPFIHRVKIEQAKRMLEEGGDRISGIADRLGFQDPNYFARLFRQHTGVSPNRYRSIADPWTGDAL